MSRSSTLIPHVQPAAITIDDLIVNYDPLYPDVSISKYRREYRNDDTVTDERLKENIETALIFINDALEKWRNDNLELLVLNNIQQQLYGRAVYHRTKQYIIKQYPDIDTTGNGADKAESMRLRIKDEQQGEREVIRLLTGRSRTTVTLI